MRRSQARAVVVSLAVVGALLGSLFSAGNASAQSRSAGTPLAATRSGQVQASTIQAPVIDRVTAVPSTGKVSCYGYTGTFKTGTYVVVVDWRKTDAECFGIATDRTIWHAWSGSGGWHKMPGGGYADSIAYSWFLEDTESTQREVVVYTQSSDTHWCQDFGPAPNGWDGYWFACE